ncbi:oligosaccharide flippase family protein [Citrobacter koseri]|uniref:oligosaccharide flippase family protein n=1 Tax=Citrobacter TaxID=544 RepID=UPI000E131664|nr:MULTISPECIES: oligosaccharide flippase family protein [Citrobacter]MBJ8671098.1 oligosaccharide flippase family protein [Citrobacter koseri]MBJ8763984.1 oligosaccharide flippase family protein [Citrobacter koseri]MBJ9228769.1 oligosaccharide flippase family protein [Citrobacter koseri]MDM3003070.1 oligosaccharide flippase family protein [Citrobacter sp. CK188]MDM3065646.1 oligosaccharide flippase family protein [Citrobacter sp. CK180]
MAIKNFIYQFSDKIFRIVYIFLMTYIAAKVLGNIGFGEFSLLATTITIALGVGTFGFEHTLVKKITENVESEQQYEWLFAGISVRLAVAIFLLICGHFVINNKTFYIIFCIVCILNVLNTYEYYLISHMRGEVIFWGRICSYAITIIFLFFVYFSDHSRWVYFVFVLEPIIYGSWCYLNMHRGRRQAYSLARAIFDVKKIRELFTTSFPFMLSSFAIIIYMRMDVYFIDYFLGKGAVGQYSLAVRFAEAANFLPIVIANSVYPWLVRNQNKINYRKFFDGLFLASMVVLIPASIGGTLVIKYFFGAEYQQSIPLFIILMLQVIPVFIGIGRAKVLVLENLQRYIPFFVFSGVALNALLNLALIPLMGTKGAAIATVISQFSTTLLIPLFIPRVRDISLLMLKSIITCGFSLLHSVYQRCKNNDS